MLIFVLAFKDQKNQYLFLNTYNLFISRINKAVEVIILYVYHIHIIINYISNHIIIYHIHIYIYINIYMVRNGSLRTLCQSCWLPCHQRVLKTFPGPGYLCSEDGVVWLWYLLVNLYNICYIYICIYTHIYIYRYIDR